jgi:hypothetical protein
VTSLTGFIAHYSQPTTNQKNCQLKPENYQPISPFLTCDEDSDFVSYLHQIRDGLAD